MSDLLPCRVCGNVPNRYPLTTMEGVDLWCTVHHCRGKMQPSEDEAAAQWNAANAPADPALLALDRELRIRSLLADRAANTAAANREIAQFGQWRWDHDAADKACADAIAALLAPDGAESEARVCRWQAQDWPLRQDEPRMTECGHRITFNLAGDGEFCTACGGRIVEVTDDD